MFSMFQECSSLSELPDISKWNTIKVKDMRYIFYQCSSLKLLPDISKWNISNVTDISFMFSKYYKLIYDNFIKNSFLID